MKKKTFLSFDEIFDQKTSPEIRRIKAAVDENAYWTSIFEKVLKNVANEESQKILDAIVRIGEIKQDNSIKSPEELQLLIRLNSPTAAYKFKVYGPHILRYLNRLGLKVSALQATVTS